MSKRLRLPKLEPTPESIYLNRRQFVRRLGLGTVALTAGLALPPGCSRSSSGDTGQAASTADTATSERDLILRPGLSRPDILERYPAHRNATFNLGDPLTDEVLAARYNNFYEFTTAKEKVWELAQQFEPDPWTIEVAGLCHKPRKFDIDEIYRLADLEERTYRFRCVEAWAMDVPWTGFELGRLLKAVEPKSDAKFVRFVTANRPKQMPGIPSQPWYPWPYFEGLRMDEAMNELTLLATGIYGRPLPRQHGAPFRLVVPWKYGYKSPKSIVKIELVAEQPKTFWETLQPREYPFESNIDPDVPHPRWSQKAERVLGSDERRPTLKYGGYGEYVAKLYA